MSQRFAPHYCHIHHKIANHFSRRVTKLPTTKIGQNKYTAHRVVKYERMNREKHADENATKEPVSEPSKVVRQFEMEAFGHIRMAIEK